jgi:uncharacterized membrane protein
MFLMLAALGLAFDIGRIYISRNEGQVFVDAAAMAASAQLDGTYSGLVRARSAVDHLATRWTQAGDWNLAAGSLQNAVVEFSADGRSWDASPVVSQGVSPGVNLQAGNSDQDAAAFHFARVTAADNHVDITFLQAVGGPPSFTVPVRAAATNANGPVRLVE